MKHNSILILFKKLFKDNNKLIKLCWTLKMENKLKSYHNLKLKNTKSKFLYNYRYRYENAKRKLERNFGN